MNPGPKGRAQAFRVQSNERNRRKQGKGKEKESERERVVEQGLKKLKYLDAWCFAAVHFITAFYQHTKSAENTKCRLLHGNQRPCLKILLKLPGFQLLEHCAKDLLQIVDSIAKRHVPL